MHTIKITITDKPSNSKGWGRYAASVDGRPVLRSRTGNEWVSAGHTTDELPEGTVVTVRLQVMLRIGPRRREEITTAERRVVVAPGETCTLDLRPGSQGLYLRLEGARILEG